MGGLDLIILYFGGGFKGWKDILFGMEIGKGSASEGKAPCSARSCSVQRAAVLRRVRDRA